MYTFVIAVHVLACVLLMVVVLMQSGRGGGLTEAFSAAESVFGPKTNIFLVRVTTAFGIVFLVTSLSLAYLSAQRDKSLLMADREVDQPFDPDALFDNAASRTQAIEINVPVDSDSTGDSSAPTP